jgi:hypothetical protein
MAAAICLALDVRDAPRVTAALAVVCVTGTVVTHHVTAAVLVGVLLLGTVVARAGRDAVLFPRLLRLTAAGLLVAGVWTVLEARTVFSYIGDPIRDAFGGSDAAQGVTKVATAPGPGPVGTVVTYLAFLAAAGLVLLGLRRLWTGGTTARRLTAAGSLAFFGVLAARVVTGNGELAARGFTYALFFAAVPLVLVVTQVWSPHAPRWRRLGGAAALTLIFAGFTVVGLPPAWEAVPGRFRIAGFESGVDRRNITAAEWAATGIGPDRRTACDLGTCSVFGAYGEQEALGDASPLFYARSFGSQAQLYVRDIGIDFAAVDARLGRQKPITGSYFRNDVGVGTDNRPIPAVALEKFDRARGISRVYDNGTVRIYDLRPEDRRAR